MRVYFFVVWALALGASARAESLFLKFVVPPTATAGPPSSFTVTLELRDADLGNAIVPSTRIPSSPPTITIATATGSGTLLVGSVPLSDSTITFNQSYTAAESFSLRAFVMIGTTPVTGLSGLITVSPGPYVKVLSLYPGETALAPGGSSLAGKTGGVSTQTLNVPFSVTVKAVDAYWNIVTGAAGTARLASSPGGLITSTLTNTFSGGVATFSVAVSTPFYNLTVTADDQANPGVTAQSVALNVYGNYGFTVTVATRPCALSHRRTSRCGTWTPAVVTTARSPALCSAPVTQRQPLPAIMAENAANGRVIR